jgi:hypothetical protein
MESNTYFYIQSVLRTKVSEMIDFLEPFDLSNDEIHDLIADVVETLNESQSL